MMRKLKDNSLTKSAAEKLPTEEQAGKIVRGVLCDVDKPEYSALYDEVIRRAQGGTTDKVSTAGVFRAR
jgi:hypothetical protein